MLYSSYVPEPWSDRTFFGDFGGGMITLFAVMNGDEVCISFMQLLAVCFTQTGEGDNSIGNLCRSPTRSTN